MAELLGITSINGLSVGHWTDLEAATGCTVVLCPEGAVASADARGGATGSRELELLRPGGLVDRIHAVVLTGGSEFGLDAASGAVRWLEERGHGFPVSTGRVPVVSAAVLFDLGIGSSDVRPTAESGYQACVAAGDGPIAEGCVGAGAGATVGKVLGIEHAIKSGIGTAGERTPAGITVAALMAVNCYGEVVDPETARVLAGPRGDKPGTFLSAIEAMRQGAHMSPFAPLTNTTIGVVATDADLPREQVYRLAIMAQAGLTRVVRPAHTPVDGDIVFALATGKAHAAPDVMQLGSLAAQAVERAIVRAVSQATGLCGVPSAREWCGS